LKKIYIDDATNVSIIDDSGSFSFTIDDIENITNHHSGLHNRTPWNDYEFSVFKLKNGAKLVVTCLLLDIDKIEAIFPRDIIIRKNHFISTLKKL